MGADRDRLVAENLALVQAIAGKLKRTLGHTIDFEDLVGYGHKGLIEAAERFDARQGVSFATFAYYRIRGAMLDGLRSMGWYSRAEYARYRAEERTNEYLQSVAEREGAMRENGGASATADGDRAQTLEAVADILNNVAAVHITSLEAASTVVDERLAPPETLLVDAQLSVRVRDAVTQLPDKERRLMELYYFHDKNLEVAGAELGLSKSWACRLHARAVSLLRKALERDT